MVRLAQIGVFVLGMLLAPTQAVSQTSASEEIAIGPGDILKLKVFGQPSLSDVYEVSPDGSLLIAGLGRISEVTTLSEAEDGVRSLIDENFGLPDSAFALTIEQFRPVTVGGGVAGPGEIRYKPGLRVAQAIAMAGGADRTRSTDQLSRIIQVNRERERLALAEMRLARALIAQARLRAELGGARDFEIPFAAIELVGDETALQLKDLEIKIAVSNLSTDLIARKRVDAASAILSEEYTAQLGSRESLQTQLDLVQTDLNRLAPLIASGALTGQRILTLRRDIAQVEGLVSQAVANLAKTQTERAVLEEETQALRLQRQTTILQQLLSVEAEIMEAGTSIRAIEDSLEAASELPLETNDRATRPGQCRLAILRSAPDGSTTILDVNALTVLEPGDHLEVGPIARDCPNPFF